jgi:Ser/Thr protein kinase RdoA (MazF antagonist)
VESTWGSGDEHFYGLSPDKILDSLTSVDFDFNGWCLPYHCLENRVYEIGIDQKVPSDDPSEAFRIGKFYRPGRWNRDQIQEEHDFMKELSDHEIPVVAPIDLGEGKTIAEIPDLSILFCLYKKVGGRNLYELSQEKLQLLGRTIARIHMVGKSKESKHRLKLNADSYARGHLNFLKDFEHFPDDLWTQYEDLVRELSDTIDEKLSHCAYQRVHGDCHLGNILYRNETAYFVDFDDSVNAPAIQDLWLIAPGRDKEAYEALDHLVEGYKQMNDFDNTELKLIEPLRTLRLINYVGWVSKRYADPMFKSNFPQVTDRAYWNEHINDLIQQKRFLAE